MSDTRISELTAEAATGLALPSDHPAAARSGRPGPAVSVPLPQGLHSRLAAFARNERATPAMVVLTAFTALLATYSGQNEVALTLDLGDGLRPVQINCGGPLIFTELLRSVRDAMLDTMAGPTTDAAPTPQGDRHLVSFVLNPTDAGVHPTGADLSLRFADGADSPAVTLHHDAGCWDHTSVSGIAASLAELLDDALSHPTNPVQSLRLLSAAGQASALAAGRGPTPAEPIAETIHALVEQQAQRTPDAAAVVDGTQLISYQDLNTRANRLAHHLRSLGVGTESVVALAMPRSASAVVAVLGILKAGAAYLPIDPAYPSERISYTLADANVVALVTDLATERSLPPHRTPVIVLDSAADRSSLDVAPDTDPDSGTRAGNLAYLIYTSGSTGRPKGVEVTHQGAVNLARVVRESFDITRADRVAQFASLSFDASVWELLMALTSGACLSLVSTSGVGVDEIVRQLHDQRVTVGTFPPSFLAQVDPVRLPALRLVVSAGEACGASLAEAWSVGRRFVNAYGPTEATVCTTFGDHLGPASPTIGIPFAGVEAHALGATLEQLPGGVSGELYLAGVGLARGYHNRPRATAEAFVPNPFGAPGSRLYRSRDLARRRTDGKIQHLGRADNQVKLRGYRIELGEVESALAGHPRIAQVAVLVRAVAGAGDQLVAYLMLRQDAAGTQPTQSELHRFLASSLPDHMLPGRFVVLETMPTTTNGKIDRQALPEVGELAAEPIGTSEAPASETEQQITEIWSQFLGVTTVGRHDNFLEIGGHSLIAAQIIARVRLAFGLSRLPVRVLFEQPVLSEFASAVDAALAELAAGLAS